ncbi:MAG: class I SAM-dependent methyltransferase [Gammaproteobacteria bacterium]
MLRTETYFRSLICLPIALFVLTASAQERSVSEGINERFTGAELNTTRSASMFENENREVFSRRHDVLEAMNIEPGMAVADVGAGSGFYVEIMAAAVGSEGQVYAVEIAPNWIDYLNEKIAAEGLDNVNVVQGGEQSIELPEASIDLAFSSDTYHHFEYPQSTLASIYEALKPGGRWIVLDYDRIPGVTPAGRMNHLRLGKAEAIAETEAAGFELAEDLDLGLNENYLAIFRRP